jgi:hypothetical protein
VAPRATIPCDPGKVLERGRSLSALCVSGTTLGNEHPNCNRLRSNLARSPRRVVRKTVSLNDYIFRVGMNYKFGWSQA